jgi:KDO2-lipid IV(A) lauroyltransferase
MTWLFKFAALLPLSILRALGHAMGWLAWTFSGRHRRRHQAHWQQALASGRLGCSKAQADHLLRASIGQAGLLMAELPKIWTDPKALRQVKTKGLDVLTEALAAGHGAILLTPHLGAFEMAARVIAQATAFTVLYRPARQAWLQRLMETLRPTPGLVTAPATGAGVRTLFRALRSGEAIGLLPDQVPHSGEGVWAPFFGRPAYTMTLPVRLIQATAAPALWVLVRRSAGGWEMSIERWQLSDAFMKASVEDAVSEMNLALELEIAKAPEQYLWAYKRYKVPKGVSPP